MPDEAAARQRIGLAEKVKRADKIPFVKQAAAQIIVQLAEAPVDEFVLRNRFIAISGQHLRDFCCHCYPLIDEVPLMHTSVAEHRVDKSKSKTPQRETKPKVV